MLLHNPIQSYSFFSKKNIRATSPKEDVAHIHTLTNGQLQLEKSGKLVSPDEESPPEARPPPIAAPIFAPATVPAGHKRDPSIAPTTPVTVAATAALTAVSANFSPKLFSAIPHSSIS